jgi:hypothetical protein
MKDQSEHNFDPRPPCSNSFVFFDVGIGKKKGRVIFELFDDVSAPFCAELCFRPNKNEFGQT